MKEYNKEIFEIKVEISIELGRKKMPIRDILKTNHGSIIELDSDSKDPLVFYVNNKKFGTCKLVQKGDKLGMQVVEIFNKKVLPTE